MENFNPRTPCGVRQLIRAWTGCQEAFQSTHPVWGATGYAHVAETYGLISIHAPRVGCDGGFPGPTRTADLFQSTHPVWGATLRGGRLIPLPGISIHAPRVGCDGCAEQGQPAAEIFQSTHPVWGATLRPIHQEDTLEISIHAPRVGCDPLRWSTPPEPWNFNPRTPCGVRRKAPQR